jgi:hypothetical protein
MGRPAFEPSLEQRRAALRLAKLGVSDREIARSLRIDRKTLVKSELGYEVSDARLALKVKLLRPLVRDALDRFGSSGPELLKRLDRCDPPEGPGEAENDQNGEQNA